MMEKLLEYQSVDAELKAIEQELSANEDRKKGIAAKKFLDGVNDSLAELDAKAAEFDSAYTKYTQAYAKLCEVQQEFEGTAGDYSGEDEIVFIKKKAQELIRSGKCYTPYALAGDGGILRRLYVGVHLMRCDRSMTLSAKRKEMI